MSVAALTGESTHKLLEQHEWEQRRGAHEARVRAWTEPHRARAIRGGAHPGYDLLFNFYPDRPTWLRRWHPGFDVTLTGAAAAEFLQWKEYRATSSGVSVCPLA